MKHNAFQLLLGVLLLTLNCRSYSQSTNWDSILTGSQWYVPPQNTLAYLTSTSNFTQTVQVGDQTLWSIISCVNGFFAETFLHSPGPKTLFRLEGVGRPLKDSHFKFM